MHALFRAVHIPEACPWTVESFHVSTTRHIGIVKAGRQDGAVEIVSSNSIGFGCICHKEAALTCILLMMKETAAFRVASASTFSAVGFIPRL